jgi:transposase InsO family protein
VRCARSLAGRLLCLALKRDIFAYIEGFYNRTRRHSAIGYIGPIQMELKAA